MVAVFFQIQRNLWVVLINKGRWGRAEKALSIKLIKFKIYFAKMAVVRARSDVF